MLTLHVRLHFVIYLSLSGLGVEILFVSLTLLIYTREGGCKRFSIYRPLGIINDFKGVWLCTLCRVVPIGFQYLELFGLLWIENYDDEIISWFGIKHFILKRKNKHIRYRTYLYLYISTEENYIKTKFRKRNKSL